MQGKVDNRTKIVAFDFDGTLTYRDTLFPFLCNTVGIRNFILNMVAVLPTLIGYQIGLIPKKVAKQRILSRYLKGKSMDWLRQKAEEFSMKHLPRLLRPDALDRFYWHKGEGHRCLIISASLEHYIRPWARQAGFDDVIGTRLEISDAGYITGNIEGLNCFGEEKVQRLESKVGPKANYILYAYGDSPGDKDLLSHADYPYYRLKPFVNKNKKYTNSLIDLFRLMRPDNWIKNAFVFIGLIFSHVWHDSMLLYKVIFAAISFSLISSAIYIVNDISDRENDRNHPKKKFRPIASGKVSIGAAVLLSVLLYFLGLSIGYSVSNRTLSILVIYIVLNLAYSYGCKRIVILDIFIIAAGFMLRILTGTVGVGIHPSQWLLFCGLMVTLFLGFTKRLAEIYTLQDKKTAHRQVLEDYSPILLDKMIVISAAGIIMSYSLYTMSPDTIQIHKTENLIYTIPFVTYGIFRYIYLLHRQNGGGDPIRELFLDHHILFTVTIWLITTVWLIS